MSGFLLLLKIIGILLLVILGLAVFAVLMVLFCPLLYHAEGGYHGNQLHLRVRIWWLGGLLGFGADTQEEGLSTYWRIFGIRKKRKSRDNGDDFADTGTEEETGTPVGEEAVTMTAMEDPATDDEKAAAVDTDPKRLEMPEEKPWTKFRRRLAGIASVFDRVKQAFQKAGSSRENLKKTWDAWLVIWNDGKNKQAFFTLKEELWKLTGILKPRRVKLTLLFAAGSPDTTGQLLGVFALFPAVYKQEWNIMPDFTADEAYAEADFVVTGHLFGIQILKLALRILLDKNCRRLYNRIRHQN